MPTGRANNPKGVNQYSRGNAAQVRNMHKGAKQEVSRKPAMSIMADTSASGRRGIASQIRGVRKISSLAGGRQSPTIINMVTSAAAASTRLRNLGKRK